MYLKFDDSTVGLKTKPCDMFAIRNNEIPMEGTAVDIPLSKLSNLYLKRAHFPLMLAWACIIWNVQGLMLQKVCLSLDLQKQKNFSAGQLHVALSTSTW